MKKIKITLVILMIFTSSMPVTGCWNYREIDKMAIVAGVAVDRGIKGKYKVTVEIAEVGGGKEAKTISKIISMEGNTVFDAVRNTISITGKRLYWSHAKVIIISKEIASEGVIKVLDWYNRDSETRNDVKILISQGNSAEEILKAQAGTEDVKSFVLDEMLKSEESLSKAPIITMFQFDNDLKSQGLSPIAPAINLKQTDDEISPHIMGTAIFNKDKLVGFINGEETKDLIFIRNMVKGGVLVEGAQDNNTATPVSLEIFKSKTQVIPDVNDKNIRMNLNIDTEVAIDEIEGTENFIDEEGRIELEQNAERKLKKQIESLIEKVQSEYGTDIFGFGAKLREDKIQEWNRVGTNWEETFKDLKVDVSTKVHIKNSAIFSKPLEADK